MLIMMPTIFIGCGKTRSTPPGASSCFGVVQEGVHCTFLKWEEGLAIMLVDRMNNHTGNGSSSTNDPLHRHRGSAMAEDGSGYDWEVATSDGQTASIKIDGTPYDLANGAVFAVEVSGQQVTVHQLDLGVSKLGNRIEECSKFLRDNPEIVQKITSPTTSN
jgi:hypothetical protein